FRRRRFVVASKFLNHLDKIVVVPTSQLLNFPTSHPLTFRPTSDFQNPLSVYRLTNGSALCHISRFEICSGPLAAPEHTGRLPVVGG
ncbi:MAG: hypothetical protein P8X90_24070, partial [Desulfobacterales bacterium]